MTDDEEENAVRQLCEIIGYCRVAEISARLRAGIDHGESETIPGLRRFRHYRDNQQITTEGK